ncbi:5-methyltetrahydropteroyltriglutamate--homocysteine S-methyltransferase [Pseudonocardia sp. TRM90224]|uniref:5-methyltetrahydropteroyltriglutamate-- homocysteine S-methyltransferase n=1 Tax=Pseudonocardia sp. TRM90224 TaxID=2812678 RepID=UPI001E48D00B|nr:5-methyltetrahydropteroyltriglutamate--homocysteine S-methyltransferase [Pseudonocardia sp. TRM90224]
MTQQIGSTVLGYPRIGPDRELKRAVERYWAGTLGEDGLRAAAAELRRSTWTGLRDAGLGSVSSNTFSYYDHVLDMARTVGAVPARFAELGRSDIDTLFAMARGTDGVAPLELTKFFDTNYHYLVPELGPDTALRLADRKPVDEYREARAAGVETRPVLLGPVSFLLMAKGHGVDPLDLLDRLVEVYAELLGELAAAGASWVQLDEPAFVADRSGRELAALGTAYRALGAVAARPKILVAAYYGDLGPALQVLAESPVEAISLDLVAGASDLSAAAALPALREKTVLAGVVDGRNVWRTDLDVALGTAATLLGTAGRVEIATSCSLLHVPYDVEGEPALGVVKDRLAFAAQKVEEVVLLGRALHEGRDAVASEFAAAKALRAVDRADERDEHVRARLDTLGADHYRRGSADARTAAQRSHLALGPVPTTTIGSFPQTAQIRKDRAAHRSGTLDDAAYESRMRAEIERVIRLQEEIGLDVLVHGEPERNDMVQYFAENLAGFAITQNGWVQSYGTRCVRPPVLYADVSRPAPITVGWSSYAQSLTSKPVKAMLTGPVTILAWSFVRADQPLGETARQVGLALRDEVRDLEAAGLRVIQVDEPALRELLPLRAAAQPAYLEWSVDAFRLVTGGVADSTQVHTHLCYSEFEVVVPAIDALDADVTTVEAARSSMAELEQLGTGVTRGIGPGVYDVHSPQVPSTAEIERLLSAAGTWVTPDRLWANPDCGLKTRGEREVTAALRNLVAAARAVRP